MFRTIFLQRVQSCLSNAVAVRTALNSHHQSTVSATTNSDVDFALEQSQIDEAIKIAPELSCISAELWTRSHQTFVNHGLKTINFLQIVTGYPAILSRQPNKVVNSFELWRSCQFGEKLLHLLLIKYPSFLDVTDGHRLVKQITFLKGFVGTNKNVWKLLMTNPDIMEQSEKSIAEKIEYITLNMRIEIPELVKSDALSKSLHDIRCRHVFLDRLGLFKPRPLKADPNEPTKNNRLYQITDTSDKTFATKICHVSLAEFEAFQDLYRQELDKGRYSEDSDGLSDDEDDGEERRNFNKN